MGVRKESVSKAFSGNKSYLTNTFILKFNNAFDNMFNNDWLMEGKGDNLASSSIINFSALFFKLTSLTFFTLDCGTDLSK